MCIGQHPYSNTGCLMLVHDVLQHQVICSNIGDVFFYWNILHIYTRKYLHPKNKDKKGIYILSKVMKYIVVYTKAFIALGMFLTSMYILIPYMAWCYFPYSLFFYHSTKRGKCNLFLINTMMGLDKIHCYHGVPSHMRRIFCVDEYMPLG